MSEKTQTSAFRKALLEGIPDSLPPARQRDPEVPHAPKRKDILDTREKKLAIRNALRYFPKAWHADRKSTRLNSSHYS